MDNSKSGRKARTLSIAFSHGTRRRRRSEDTTIATTVEDGECSNTKIQEMLQQSLRREADTLRKLRHLSEMYQQLLYRSHSPAWESESTYADRDSPDLIASPPDTTTATSVKPIRVISPQLVVVNGERSLAEKETTYVTDARGDNCAVQGNCWCANNGVSVEDSLSRTTTSLAPLPQGLRDIRREREKPPTFKNIEQANKLSTCSVVQVESGVKREDEAHITSTDFRKSMSRSDEHLYRNPIGRTKSVPGKAAMIIGGKKDNEHDQRGGSFWRRRARKTVAPDTVVEHYDVMFAHFQKTARTKPDPLNQYLDTHWSQLYPKGKPCSDTEIKYRNAVWDLFQSESKYLLHQLQPLEKVYKGFLEELHFHTILTDASTDKIFANISEVVELSSQIANDLFKLFDQRSEGEIALPNELILLFSMFGHKFNPVYKQFCTNFEQQRGYIKLLEKKPAFQEYLRVCRTAPAVQRNDLSDLLITPMQHQCHYQLLLEKVLKYTEDPSHRSVLSSTIKAFVVSLKELESAIAQQRCSLELLELQETIQWPQVYQLCPDAYIPQTLEEFVHKQPCSNLLASPSRHLHLRGNFKQLDSRGKVTADLHLVLLSDLLLVTESRKGSQLVVLQQPIPISLLSTHNIPESIMERPAMTVIARSTLGQQIFLLSLIAPSREDKEHWLSELKARGASSIPPDTQNHSE